MAQAYVRKRAARAASKSTPHTLTQYAPAPPIYSVAHGLDRPAVDVAFIAAAAADRYSRGRPACIVSPDRGEGRGRRGSTPAAPPARCAVRRPSERAMPPARAYRIAAAAAPTAASHARAAAAAGPDRVDRSTAACSSVRTGSCVVSFKHTNSRPNGRRSLAVSRRRQCRRHDEAEATAPIKIFRLPVPHFPNRFPDLNPVTGFPFSV